MKKIISFFLVITLIMSSLNFETVEALSNKINEVYNTVSKSESEEMNSMEDKESELEEVSDSEKASDSEGEKSQSEETADSEDKEIGFEGKKDSEEDKVDTEDTNDSNENEISSYANENQSVRVYDGTPSNNKGYYTKDSLKQVIEIIKSKLLNSSEITIEFRKNYSITSEDANAMKFYFTNERLIFEAEKGVTVEVTEDLMFHHDRNIYPTYLPDPAPVITFQNINLKFTSEHNIFANGLRLHMGKNIKMIGSNYPNLFGGKSSSVPAIMEMGYASDIYIESGTYNEVTTASDNGGLDVTGGSSIRNSNVNLYGGYVKEISLNKSNQGKHYRKMNVSIYGGKVDKVYYSKAGWGSYIDLIVNTNITINEVEVRSLIIEKNKKLTVDRIISIGSDLRLGDNSTFEMGENVPQLYVNSFVIGNESKLRLPGGRSKDEAPLFLASYPLGINKLNLELSSKGDKEDFYLMNTYESAVMDRDFFKISEDEYFYLDQILYDKDDGVQYVKGKLKESGPLIYDTDKDKITYVGRDDKEHEPWWIQKKIDDGTIDLGNLTYDGLAKAEDYYVLSPDPITIKIRGSGSNITFKLNNDRSTDRKFNIEFEKLNASDSEFKFTNINSINVKGENRIIQSANSKKTGLTYSISGNDRDALTFDNDGSFVVYNKDDKGDRYDIKSNIVNSGTVGNTFIANISFEEAVNGNKTMKLQSTNSSAEVMKFPIKSGYDEMSVLLKGNNKDYLLIDGYKTNIEGVYYYQSARKIDNSNQNSGPIGTKFTLEANGSKNYYKVNNKERVYVMASQDSNNLHYLEDTLKNAMENKVAHQNGTHEVVFLGDYKITSDDALSIKNHNGNTNGITFKTKVDDWKYTVKINDDIELKNDTNPNKFIIFDKIKFKYESPDKWIYGNGRTLTFGSDVEMEGPNYPSVSGGEPSGRNGTINQSNVTINSGTYEKFIGNIGNNTARNINLTINNGTFNGEVSGIDGGKANNATLTIKDGTFASKVTGAKEGSTINGALNLTIDAGTFNGVVVAINGAIVSSPSKLTINNGKFKEKVYGISSGSNLTGNFDFEIGNGTFEKRVLGASSDVTRGIFKRFIFGKNMRGNLTGTLKIKINNGTFIDQVTGLFSWADNATVNLELLGGDFNDNLVAIGGTTKDGTANVNITDGMYRGHVTGQFSQWGTPTKSVEINIAGGTFNNLIYGSVSSEKTTININGGTFNPGSNLEGRYSNGYGSTININNNITLNQIGKFDKLVVGKNGKATLAVKNKIVDSANSKSELVMNNGSEVKLEGTDQSQVKKLEIDDSGNTLTLAMDRDTAQLLVKGDYNHNSNKLTLKASGNKVDNKEVIDFSTMKADVNNFNFMDSDYYIREMDNNTGNKVKIFKKMDPKNLTFKVDIDGKTLEYFLDNSKLETVWWYNPKLSDQDISFLADDMFKYKGMELFKDMTKIASGAKVFEINNSTVDNKNITIDLGVGKDFDLKLNNSKLNNSTLNANNIKDLVLEGANSISELTGTKNPFDSNISGEVKSTNTNSYLSIFTDESNIPFSGSLVNGRKDVAKVIDFKFYKKFTKEDEVRLATSNGGSELALTVPTGTGRLGVVFGKNNANQTYKLYHGKQGNTGTSVYVAGNTDAKFRESFDASLNDSSQTYEYVRRANPVRSAQVDVTRGLSFSVDTSTVGLHGINPTNWQQYFNSTDLDVENDSVSYKDEFIDENGKAHHFGKTTIDLEFGYLGVSPSNNNSNSIELVDKNVLDPNITSSTSGVKLALKFNDGINDIPLDESGGIGTNPLETWTVSSNSNKSLKIVPDFNGNTFYNVSRNSPAKMSSSHNFVFRFGLVTP